MSPEQNQIQKNQTTSSNPNRIDQFTSASPAQRVPPQDLAAEVCVLGSMVLDSEGIGEIIPLLRTEYFYRQDHRLIFDALVGLYESNKPVDVVLLCEELERRGQLEQIGGEAYLVDLVTSVPSSANMIYYAAIVRDKAMLRNLISAGSEITNRAYEARGDVGEIMEEAEQKIFEVTQQKITGQASKIRDILNQAWLSIRQREGQNITGLATGYHDLDEITSGLQDGEMIIIAARPSMGKTALGLNIAEYVAADNGKPAAIFSLEMGAQQLVERMLAGRSHINSHKLRKGLLGDEEYKLLGDVANDLSQAPIFVDDSPGLTPLELRAKARRLKLQFDIKLVVVDYLQLMHVPGSESRVQEVGTISRHIKALARELNVPVVAMAQLNRSPEGREGHRPRMSDLRESGNIEQDADVIIMLHRESYYRHMSHEDIDKNSSDFTHDDIDDNTAELIITKQRNGPTGTIKLLWHPQWTRFENLARMPEPFGY
ncbi:MAG: replicative DNA helicase [Sedimentisphaerales bacterium]|nr:replicative DNA helicase [Sedimentisphaerales bacterium]